MKEALSGETDARVAATSELEARLVAKERAESDKDKAETQFRELKQNYLGKVDALAKAQDAANDEVRLTSHHPVVHFSVPVHVSQTSSLLNCMDSLVCSVVPGQYLWVWPENGIVAHDRNLHVALLNSMGGQQCAWCSLLGTRRCNGCWSWTAQHGTSSTRPQGGVATLQHPSLSAPCLVALLMQSVV